MENAKYHKGRPFDTAKGNWKKGDLYQACVKFKVPGVSSTDLKATIWAALKKHIDEHIPPAIVEMARTRGYHLCMSMLDLRVNVLLQLKQALEARRQKLRQLKVQREQEAKERINVAKLRERQDLETRRQAGP
ncbi:hypothetical protein H310_13383 [Aphanomyces invadans]|uniref:Uncharacterized protein n=1 Tax=Aphanomyces invadans TaxID=157072 RepID=A0A024TG73_9STRA|nr:hypothetical protein H310_13383 [Aphanomyces invadans]ETV92337.1 hypothetical protein H310_13383 [Aphanomyces invadans]|eukprot:XP_008879088.1 hypothetical protein H310_13383 [Aphanomyces invadans]